MVNELTIIDEIFDHLIVLFKNMQDIEAKMIDTKTFEVEMESMPEFMRNAAYR